ncbi:DUF1566 domain-containing protein [Patescibacteria group bacterium]|nr:DUF1566 domain-containing protein [Patescibacteria group bacterium]
MSKKILVCLAGSILLVSGIASWVFKPNWAEAGKVVFKRNVVIRAFYALTQNGSAGSLVADYLSYTKDKGGVDDYNNGGTMPADSYRASWITCGAGNNWCNTGDATYAEKKDNSTGLVWSIWLESGTAKTWFWANNCYYSGVSTSCDANDEDGCICTKLTSSKTGCEALGGGWRLPHQKELMQVYIDGSWGNLSSAGNYCWSATTRSGTTQNAWNTSLYDGYTYFYGKTGTVRVRCVR